MSIESDTMQYFNATTDQGADPAHVELLPQVEHCPKKKKNTRVISLLFPQQLLRLTVWV